MQRLTCNIVDKPLVTVDHSNKRVTCLEWASEDYAGHSTALQGGDHLTRFLAAYDLAGHGAALRSGELQGSGLQVRWLTSNAREIVVNSIGAFEHNVVQTVLILSHASIRLHLRAESGEDDLTHGV